MTKILAALLLVSLGVESRILPPAEIVFLDQGFILEFGNEPSEDPGVVTIFRSPWDDYNHRLWLLAHDDLPAGKAISNLRVGSRVWVDNQLYIITDIRVIPTADRFDPNTFYEILYHGEETGVILQTCQSETELRFIFGVKSNG